ncbi:hypothetical protein, partial [Pectobacterium carotovorum]|uniref:hypothetical protein n=1 Tax=Pectobacterium carotovorum TaxID=554 RepID=UPI003015E1E9
KTLPEGGKKEAATLHVTATFKSLTEKHYAFGGGFSFLACGLFIEHRSIIRRKRLTLSGPARQARCSTPPAFVRVRAPLI